jgi:hypothetical protein
VLVAGADLLCEKNTAGCGWSLVLVWCQRKTLLVGWLTNKQNRVFGVRLFKSVA